MTSGEDERGAPAPEERDGERSGGEAAPEGPGTGRRAGTVPDPEPEEAPELLGERSDYPIAWDGEES